MTVLSFNDRRWRHLATAAIGLTQGVGDVQERAVRRLAEDLTRAVPEGDLATKQLALSLRWMVQAWLAAESRRRAELAPGLKTWAATLLAALDPPDLPSGAAALDAPSPTALEPDPAAAWRDRRDLA